MTREKKGMPRPCKKCGDRFVPTSFGSRTCEKCIKEAREARYKKKDDDKL